MKYNKSVFLILLFFVLIFSACSKKDNSVSDFSDIEENASVFSNQKISLGKDKIEFECRVYDKNKILLPLEIYCSSYKIKYEVCARCGHTKIFLPKLSTENVYNVDDLNLKVELEEKIVNQTDVMQVEWNSPYISYANKDERQILNCKTINENGITWVSIEILNYFDDSECS